MYVCMCLIIIKTKVFLQNNIFQIKYIEVPTKEDRFYGHGNKKIAEEKYVCVQ